MAGKESMRCLVVGLVAALWCGVLGCASTGNVLRLEDGATIGFSRMISEVKNATLVFVGETHENPEHHRLQLDVIRALHRDGGPLAVGLEMFVSASQPDLDLWVAGKLGEEAFVRLYAQNWNLPWPLYRDIFRYARDNRIPLVALNVPRPLVQKVARNGFESLSPAEKEELPPGISCNVDAAYLAFIRKAYSGHFGSEKSFIHFCEAQMVWTKSMAWRLIGYLNERPDRLVVVLTGAGHALKQGVPGEVRENAPYSYRVILPEIPELSSKGLTSSDADYYVLKAP